MSENVFDLGSAVDPASGKHVRGYAIVHYKKGYAKPSGAKTTTTSSCYGYLAKGAKWKVVEPWQVNPVSSGLNAASVFGVIAGGVAKWEDAADGVINGVMGADILGNGTITNENLLASVGTLNGKNEVYFGSLEPGTIAVTYVWGIFYGPTFQRELVEWDQVYNTYYPWSLAGEAGKMDLDNIVTHELGHSVGMADLYTLSCGEETMYGYADFGEIKKRDLNVGDITGVDKLY